MRTCTEVYSKIGPTGEPSNKMAFYMFPGIKPAGLCTF